MTEPVSFSFVPLSPPRHGLGGPCPKCKRPVRRTFYADAEINGQRKSVVIELCPCQAVK